MMNMKEVLVLWFTSFLDKKILVEQLNPYQINNLQINFITNY